MLNDEDRKTIENRLLREREDALEDVGEFDREFENSPLDESGELTFYRFHMADIGTEAMEREKQFLLASQEGEHLYRIDEALRRLYSEPERFGTCVRCGKEIGLERLMIVPEVELCASCQRELER
jgi:RNA polymerase-binding transcription factor DksA